MSSTSTPSGAGKRTLADRSPFIRKVVRRFGLRGKLLLALLPPIVAVLLASGYASYTVSEEFIDIALGRTVRVHTLAVTHELEQYLDESRKDLLFFAHGDLSPEELQDTLERRLAAGGKPYFELCYIPASGGEPVALVRQGREIRRVRDSDLPGVRPNPFALLDSMGGLADGTVTVSDITEVSYPMPTTDAANLFQTRKVIRLITRVDGEDGSPGGVLFLSIEASHLRNILSWYNSPESPLWAFPRSDELRFSYFLDKDGWMLFQSENYAEEGKDLATYLAREDFTGTLGRPGNEAAFRPNEKFRRYWGVVEAIRQGDSGLIEIAQDPGRGSSVKSYYFSYAPVSFRIDPGQPPVVLGGVVFVDRSLLPVVAGYKNLDVMLFVTIVAIILISLLIFWFGRILTKPIRVLAAEVNSMSSLEDMEEIRLPYSGFTSSPSREPSTTSSGGCASRWRRSRPRTRSFSTSTTGSAPSWTGSANPWPRWS